MRKVISSLRGGGWMCAAVGLILPWGLVAPWQTQGRRPMDPPIAAQPETPQRRTRLILKDGTFQSVLSYRVAGDRVRYRSAERGGEEEEIPLALVDMPATKAWEQAHDPAQMN